MLAPEMEADGICQSCRVNPGTLVMDPFALDDPMVPVVLCPDCYREACADV